MSKEGYRKHCRDTLNLVYEARNKSGWTKISKSMWPSIARVPGRFLKKKRTEDGGAMVMLKKGGLWIIGKREPCKKNTATAAVKVEPSSIDMRNMDTTSA